MFLSDHKLDPLYIEFWMGHAIPERQRAYIAGIFHKIFQKTTAVQETKCFSFTYQNFPFQAGENVTVRINGNKLVIEKGKILKTKIA